MRLSVEFRSDRAGLPIVRLVADNEPERRMLAAASDDQRLRWQVIRDYDPGISSRISGMSLYPVAEAEEGS